MKTHKPFPKKDFLDGQEIEINEEFRGALEILENTRKCIFVTGKAGTGKSTLLKYFVNKTKKKTVLLAPTGVAALNIGGVTIHSFFRFPPRPITDEDIRNSGDEIYKYVDTIVIDEISMVRADMLDAIDKYMRINGKYPHKPFGGTQMIFFGDLYQLEPIVKGEEETSYIFSLYKSPWFFDSIIFQELDVQLIELETVYRQKEKSFIELLDAIRKKQYSINELDKINNRYDNSLNLDLVDSSIILTCTNRRSKNINLRKLHQIKTRDYTYLGKIEGEFLKERLPTEIELKLKKGAKVMFIKNDLNKRWVNGTIGEVHTLDDESIKVEVKYDKQKIVYDVEIVAWEILRYRFNSITKSIETEVVGVFRQFPLKLAWAVTIHKSQGLTFDNLIIDLENRAFSLGQTYVALSRCTNYDGIILKRPIRHDDIIVDISVNRYFDSVEIESNFQLTNSDTPDEAPITYKTSPQEVKRNIVSPPKIPVAQEEISEEITFPELHTESPKKYRLPITIGLSVIVVAVVFALINYPKNPSPQKLQSTTEISDKSKLPILEVTENNGVPTITIASEKSTSTIPVSIVSTEDLRSTPSCIIWSSINKMKLGKSICVFGKINKIGSTTQYPIIIRFSDELGTFLIRGPSSKNPEPRCTCVKVEGILRQDITYLYMNTNDVEISEFDGCD